MVTGERRSDSKPGQYEFVLWECGGSIQLDAPFVRITSRTIAKRYFTVMQDQLEAILSY